MVPSFPPWVFGLNKTDHSLLLTSFRSRSSARCSMSEVKPKTIVLTSLTCVLTLQLFYRSRFLQCMPSTATTKRLFSAMNRIKTYVRSTMTDCTLYPPHLQRNEIDRQEVISIFARQKKTKLEFI